LLIFKSRSTLPPRKRSAYNWQRGGQGELQTR
jgi:hypothetical protein